MIKRTNERGGEINTFQYLKSQYLQIQQEKLVARSYLSLNTVQYTPDCFIFYLNIFLLKKT